MNYRTTEYRTRATLLAKSISISDCHYCWVQSDGTIRYISDAWTDTLGLSEHERFDLPLSRICPDMDRISWQRLTRRLLSEQPQNICLSFSTPSGQEQQWVTLLRVVVEEQTFVGIHVISHTKMITHPLVQQLSEQADCGVWMWQMGMTHLHLSELGNDILKAIYPNLTQTFVPLSEIQEILRLAFDTTDRSKLIRAMHDLSTISSSSTIQVRIITTQQQLLISAKSEVSKGRMISCFGTFQYTTQTTPLLTRQQLATQLLHHHPLPLIIVDRQWSIKLLNQAAIRIVGRPKEQLEMQSLTSIFPQIADTFELDNHLPTALVHTKTSARFKDAQWSVVEVGIQSVVHHGQTHFMVMWQTTAQQKLTTPPPSTSDVVSDSLAQQADSNIISQNAAYQMVLQQIAQVAATNTTVLILGETGTGKELLAKSVHRQSTRMNYPLVKVNCAALPENLIESELFGHEAGAFTGATGQKIGRFELADGGTIFLDEIGELPIELQPKLLRVLQEGEFERVGGSETIKTDVRVIAATNRDLVQLIEKGGFREDLYYRLHVFPIHNIPLRERRDDIPLLVKHFIQKYSKKNSKNIHDIQVKALKKLMGYDFPGNIRELENIVERGIILTQGKKLSLDHWHPTQRRTNPSEAPLLSLEEVQRQHIIQALKRTKWRVSGPSGAAKLLRMNAKTLETKMRKYKLTRSEYFKTNRE